MVPATGCWEKKPALLTIGHPEGPQPLSGIRGYAISLRTGGSGSAPWHQPLALQPRRRPISPGGAADDLDSRSAPSPIGHHLRPRRRGLRRWSSLRRRGSAVLRVERDARRRLSLLGVPDGWSAGPGNGSPRWRRTPSSGMTASRYDGAAYGDSPSTAALPVRTHTATLPRVGSTAVGVTFDISPIFGPAYAGRRQPQRESRQRGGPERPSSRVDEDPPRVEVPPPPRNPRRAGADRSAGHRLPLSGPSFGPGARSPSASPQPVPASRSWPNEGDSGPACRPLGLRIHTHPASYEFLGHGLRRGRQTATTGAKPSPRRQDGPGQSV